MWPVFGVWWLVSFVNRLVNWNIGFDRLILMVCWICWLIEPVVGLLVTVDWRIGLFRSSCHPSSITDCSLMANWRLKASLRRSQDSFWKMAPVDWTWLWMLTNVNASTAWVNHRFFFSAIESIGSLRWRNEITNASVPSFGGNKSQKIRMWATWLRK